MRENNTIGLALKQLKLLRQNCMIAGRSVNDDFKCLDVTTDYLNNAESLYCSLKARPLSSEDSFAYRIIIARAWEAYETAQEIVNEKSREAK